MILFFLLFLAPLSGVIAFTMTLSAHWMHSASDQIRLDATSLSLCHSQKAFYQLQIKPLNSQIRLVQVQMIGEVALCIADPAYCPSALLKLERLQGRGQRIMQAQDHLRRLQMAKQLRRFMALKNVNQLGERFGILETTLQTSDGLKRELVRPTVQQSSSLGTFTPPLALVPSEQFNERNTYRLAFKPFRSVLGKGDSISDLEPTRILVHRSLQSNCQVPWDHNVKRLRDQSDYDISL